LLVRVAAGLGLALALLGTGSAQAQMYKCVDARGVTHYSDKPRADCTGGPVDIRPIPPVSGKVSPPPDNRAQQDADFKRRQNERDRSARDERTELERRCSGLRQERAKLSGGRRLAEMNERGEQVYVDDATRERRLAELQTALRGCP
jgi:hypothetical protein